MNNISLSIVIPLAKGERQWLRLCDDFSLLPDGSEIIIVACNGEQLGEQLASLKRRFCRLSWQLIYSTQGRGIQLNKGAALARQPFIWFLHADSQITADNINALLACLANKNSQNSLFYFDLYFFDKSSWRLKINEAGARFRSNLLGLPFGDQGFFVSKETFNSLGGYREDTPYGEDHLLVWQAKQQGVKLRRCASQLATSARKYELYGWRSLTLKYQYLWPKQAIPQLVKLIKIKFF
ncbi:MAG: hypothetical protein ACJAT7_002827 [Psychromonas sp.]|jgi:hypothetical protein|uniref:glycosyltransferase n=1 Tax=Psychromonas sp. TaxID=1884585 RepID=UPI0039E49450